MPTRPMSRYTATLRVPNLGPSSHAVRQMTKFASEMGTAPMGTVSGPSTHIAAAISAVTAI